MQQVDASAAALDAEIRACQTCGLCTTRTNAVPGDGPINAAVMAVGEAPGQTEDATGHPFVGAAGNLLNSLLEGIGLSRSAIFITNIVKCRPPGNRDPLDGEVAACAPYLDQQIDLVKPEVILLLGRHALHRLIPDAPTISKAHGTVLTRGERTYIPLYHPAAALYNGSLLTTLREDMNTVHQVLRERGAAQGSGNSGNGNTLSRQLSLSWTAEEQP